MRTPVSSEATTAARRSADRAGVAPGIEARLGPAQHVGQPTLADGQAEQVRERLLQAFVG